MSASDFRILASAPSVLGMVCLRQRDLLAEPGGVVTEITLDHQFLMSSHNAASERALAQRALALHPGQELRVLVGGLGLGCTARAALASERVRRLEVIELLPEIIDWFERGVLPDAAELTADPRFAVREADVYALLSSAPGQEHDLILIDVDHSPDERLAEGSAPFYTTEGLSRAKKHLAPGGILGVWSYAESPRFARALREAFPEVRVEPVTSPNPVLGGEETNWLFFARG